MDNLFNDQVVPVTRYDIEKFKKDYSINNCVASEDLQYDSATNRYFTTSTDIYIKKSNRFSRLVDTVDGVYSSMEVDTPFSGCYIKGYDIGDNQFATSKLLQEKIDSKLLEINQSNFTGYYHKITYRVSSTSTPTEGEVQGEQRGTQENNKGTITGYYPVFHTDDILELRKKPSEKFIKYFFYSLFTTILLAVIACCTEFWLIYSGDHNKRTGKDREISIVIENSCTNIGKKDDDSNEKSYNCDILEQVFRWRIWNYPYQKCNDTIKESKTDTASIATAAGGAKSRYDYHYNEEPPEYIKTDKGKLSPKNHINECKVEGEKIEFGHRPFPYNIGEKADQLFTSELSRIIPRNVGYVILFIMLMYRYLVYHMFKNISNFYNESLRDLPIIKIIIFFASPILISLFINIVPILSTIGVLFFILFMIVQILQFFTDISNSDSSSPKMQSKEAFLVIIICAILCYIVSIIISEIAFTSSYNTAKGERCNYVDNDEILQELKRIEYETRNQRLKDDTTELKEKDLNAKYNLIIFKKKLKLLLSEEEENVLLARGPAAVAAAAEKIKKIENRKCLNESEFNSSFKTCKTAIDRYFSTNHNILTGISGDNLGHATISSGQINGEISYNQIFVETYLNGIVSEYIKKVESDKRAITGIFYTLLILFGIFIGAYIYESRHNKKQETRA